MSKMKLSRRQTFGAAIGGAFAAPNIVKAMQAEAKTFAPTPSGYYAGVDKVATEGCDANWTMQQIAKMKRIASGDIRDEDRNYPTEGNPQPFRSLRSVSEDARHYMRNSYYERQWRERTVKAALDALDHYDKTGILRMLF